MSNDVSIAFDAADVRAFQNAMERNMDVLRKTPKQAATFGAAMLVKSLGASMKVSPKLRPIVADPDKRYKKDGRFARYGVFKWRPNGQRYFSPIGRTGEYGKIRYRDKKTLQIMERDRVTGEVTRTVLTNDELEIFGLQHLAMINHPKRRIGRSGLAKASWQWMLRQIGVGAGSIAQLEKPGIVTTEKFEAPDNYTLRMTNRLRYIYKATRGGTMALSTAMSRAAANMMGKMDLAIARANVRRAA